MEMFFYYLMLRTTYQSLAVLKGRNLHNRRSATCGC
jgi:hypothetical protein